MPSKNLNVNRKLVIIPGVALGVIGMAGGGYYVVTHRATDLSQARVAQTQTAVLDAKYSQGLAVKRNAGTWRAQLSTLAQELPPRRDQSPLLNDITAVASSSGITLKQGSSQSGPPSAAGVSTYAISIGASGSYQQIQSFLHGLSAMPRLATIQSETLTWSKGTVSAEITLDTYSAVAH